MDMDSAMMQKAFDDTRIIRQYNELLPLQEVTLGYIVAMQHHKYQEKIAIHRGKLTIAPPIIYLPTDTINFGQGFEEIEQFIDSIRYSRSGFHSVRVSHDGQSDTSLHVGKLDNIVAKEMEILDQRNDKTTGVIIGVSGYESIAVLKYFVHLSSNSRRSNVQQVIRQMPPGFDFLN